MNRLRSNTRMALVALASCTFAICMAEFVLMGLLSEVSHDLNVTISSAGFLITGYAFGVAIGSPLLGMAMSRFPIRTQLLVYMGIFIVGNAIAAFAPNYAVLMVARVVSSLTHGTFIGLGAVAASRIVPADKQAAAISFMFTGATVANILGVPFGTFWGQHFGWRSTFEVIALLGCIGIAALATFIPNMTVAKKANLRQELRVLFSPKVIAALVMAVLSFAGVFATFTYVAPIAEQFASASPNDITIIFVVFGIGLTLGTFLAGKLSRNLPSRFRDMQYFLLWCLAL